MVVGVIIRKSTCIAACVTGSRILNMRQLLSRPRFKICFVLCLLVWLQGAEMSLYHASV
jgi:hypothetical protein